VKVVFYSAGENGVLWRDALAGALPEAEIGAWPGPAASEADYAVVWKPPRELLGSLKRAKAVFNLGAGVDGVAPLSALRPEIPLVRLEDAGMAEQMGEYACYVVLRRYRELDVYAEQQRAATWRPRRRVEKAEFAVGLLGLGEMGAAVAAALRPFGFQLLGWSRVTKAMPGLTSHHGAAGLDAVLSRSQVLICLLPLTDETRGLLNRGKLSRLPHGAYLVNLARGDLVVESDLLALLDEGHMGGAMLDVFHDEPLPASHPFWHHPKITITPHIAAATLIHESIAQIAGKIRRLEAGKPVTGVVARDRGY
jgi:glyoxylate/hydroxypyruvate reductase